ncbi:hypothetical protein KSF_004300 [Reticulibacter mediterranei]|uniref:Uncharacterized protein n=1 Tax=Reticulibacter mediterranei TaxID=2778369 RepID=A0A8J3MY02_9CHLR|nr:hypothetical protein KSF_004300 [Reticulibacter mediterranei]
MLEKPLNRGKRDDAFAVFSEHFVILAQASRANALFVEGSLVMEKVDILGAKLPVSACLDPQLQAQDVLELPV